MSDGSQENLSKRERQKQRREARKEAERSAAKRARMTRLALFALLGLAVAGGVGYLVQQAVAGRAEREEAIEEGRELASEFGCTDVQEPESLGGGHFSGPELPQNPPEAIYPHRPTTSGRHLGSVVQTGVYDSYVDERLTTHNLEHGYVVMWHAEDAPDDQVEALKTFAQERIDAGDQELVVAPYNAEMDEDANFGFVAWGNRQLCDEFDDRVALAFLNEFHNFSGSPEPNVGPHLGGGQGEIDPTSDQAVFPPLNEAAGDPGPESGGNAEGDAAGGDAEGDAAGGDAEGDAAGGDGEGDAGSEDAGG